MDILEYSIFYIIFFLLFYLFQYIFVYKRKEKDEDLGTIKSFNYIVYKYKLKMNKEKVKKLNKLIILVNTFIITVPIMIAVIEPINYFVTLIISLVIFIILIIGLYNLLGYILKKKGW